MSQVQKVTNWKEYNQSLKKRGYIIFNFDKQYLSQLYYTGKQKQGGIREYTPYMFEYLLTIKLVLRLPWRSTIGFAEGLLQKAFQSKEVKVPDYAHASREAGKLNLKLKQYLPRSKDGMELAFDSTGVNVYTTSGYHKRKYGKQSLFLKRNQWKKIHLAMDLDTMQIVAVEYTDSNTNDCVPIPKLCSEIPPPVKSVRADGAYDTKCFYEIMEQWGATAIIPPDIQAKAQDELKNRFKAKKTYLKQRDEIIKTIRQYKTFKDGLKQWKISSKYHRRSLV